MQTYEGMFLIDNNKATSDWDAVVRHVQGILEKRGAKTLSIEKWGERKLAYRIDGHKKGTYMLVYFEAPAGSIIALRRDCQLSDTVIRSLILKVAKRPEPVQKSLGEEKPAEVVSS